MSDLVGKGYPLFGIVNLAATVMRNRRYKFVYIVDARTADALGNCL